MNYHTLILSTRKAYDLAWANRVDPVEAAARVLEEAMERADDPGATQGGQRVADLKLALHWALGELIRYEPADSRAVSDEFVAAACIEMNPTDVQNCRDILTRKAEQLATTNQQCP